MAREQLERVSRPLPFSAICYHEGEKPFAPAIPFEEMVRNAVSAFGKISSPAILAGHSGGANVALAAAQQVNPQKLVGVLCLGPLLPSTLGCVPHELLSPKEQESMRQFVLAATEMLGALPAWRSMPRMAFVGAELDRAVPYETLAGFVRALPANRGALFPCSGGHSFAGDNPAHVIRKALFSLVCP